MTAARSTLRGALILLVLVAGGATDAAAQSRTVGQVIDDTAITAEVMTRLTADALSNLTKIGVSTRNGVVTLTGTVDSLDRQARAVQTAATVKGVRGVVNNIVVAGAPAAPPPPVALPEQPPVDVTGVVSQVDPSTGTIILQDGRVLRVTPDTLLWQPTTIEALRPGAQVLVRGAAPLRVQTDTGGEWRMGTVQLVDPAASRLVLTDGTVVRVTPSVNIRRGTERLTLEQIAPGSEVVIRPMTRFPTGSAEGYALPGPAGRPAAIDAAEITVVWMPPGGLR
jgi:hyperosmotically inducible protein